MKRRLYGKSRIILGELIGERTENHVPAMVSITPMVK